MYVLICVQKLHTYVCTYISIHIRTDVCMYVHKHTQTHMYVRMYIRMYIYAHRHSYTYVYIYICTYVHSYYSLSQSDYRLQLLISMKTFISQTNRCRGTRPTRSAVLTQHHSMMSQHSLNTHLQDLFPTSTHVHTYLRCSNMGWLTLTTT